MREDLVKRTERIQRKVQTRGSLQYSREEELQQRYQALRESLDMIPGLDALQLDVIERLTYLGLALADYEEKVLAGTPIDVKQYNQTLEIYSRLVRTLFDGTSKVITKAVIERMFIEKVMKIVAAEVRDPVILNKLANRLEAM